MSYLYHLIMSSKVAQRIAKVLASVVLLISYIKYREAAAVHKHKTVAAAKDVHNANSLRKSAAKAKSDAVAAAVTSSGAELDAELRKRGKLRD